MDFNDRKSEYDLLFDGLRPLIREKNLDEISVKSLLYSSISFDYPEAEPANIAIISKKDFSGGKSIKARNIKISLKISLDTVLAVKTAFSEKGCWFILCILQVILSFFENIKKEIGYDDSVVLFAVYRLRNAGIKDINAYIKFLKDSGELSDKDDIDVKASLDRLEELKTLELINGKYSLAETIIVK